MGASEWTSDDFQQCQQSFRLKVNDVIFSDDNHLELHCSSESICNGNTNDSGKCVRVLPQGVWKQNKFLKDQIIHLINPLVRKDNSSYIVDNQNGLLVTEPDNLHNCTLVASSLFCERKTWLNNVFLGQVGTNRAMLVGTLVHEVFQHGVKNKIVDTDKLTNFLDELLDDATIMLEIYSVEMQLKDVRQEAITYIPSVSEWIEKYMFSGPRQPLTNASDIEVKITSIKDIEENVWSTKYGLKGKIDVTGVVRIHDKKNKIISDKIVPLELKTGNPNLSSSHAAQVSLYSMMIEDRYCETNQGFVIYLKNKASMVNVPLTTNIKRDLIQRRNQVNFFLKNHMIGPEMLNQARVCTNCERVTECILMSKIYEPGNIDYYSTMKTIENEAIGHLDEKFIAFFKKYHEKLVSLLTGYNGISINQMKGDSTAQSQSTGEFWTRTSEEAEKSGTGFGKLAVFATDNPKIFIFKRHTESKNNYLPNGTVETKPTTPIEQISNHKQKKIKIQDYFKPTPKVIAESEVKNGKPKMRPFNTESNFNRCRVAISLDHNDQNMDNQNSSTAIAIGFINEIKENQFTMKIYEGSIDSSKSNYIYRVDKLKKRSNIDIERTVLVRLLEHENCDKIRKLILDPEFIPKENVQLNLLILSDHFELISEQEASHQKFIVGAASTNNYCILNERQEPDKSKLDRPISILVKLIRTLDRNLLIVARNTDSLLGLMKSLQRLKLPFILIDDGSSSKARYEFASNLVKVPQNDNLDLSKKFEIYVRQHESASIVITTFAMSIGGLQFTRRRFDYCIVYDADKTELLLSLSPMFCSDRYIIIDVAEDRDCIMIDESGNEIETHNVTLGQHLRLLRNL